MYKQLLLLIGLVMTISSCREKVNCRVCFIVNAPNLPKDKNVYIAGNHEKLGSWAADGVKLKRRNPSKFDKKINFSKGEELEYKFTLGSWNEEALGEKNEVLENSFVSIQKDTTIEITIKSWKSNSIDFVKGKITGNVKYHEGFKISDIPDRNVIVWLPPGYNDNRNRKYPVLYMHDGQNCFDPATSSFGVDWQIDETCTTLIENKSIQEIIVVGIYNTENRSKEYIPGNDGKVYMELITNKIKPFIDANYRTMKERENTAVGGSSAGGIISFMLAWEYPEIFSKVICMSPAFKIENIDYVKEVVADTCKKRELKIYIDNGGIGLEKKLQPGIDEMLLALKEKGYKIDDDMYWYLDTSAQHNENAWAKRMPQALIKLFELK